MKITCPTCKGDGWTVRYEGKCPLCHGTGEVEACEECNGTGKPLDWYCPDCTDYLCGQRVTSDERCDTCGTELTDVACPVCNGSRRRVSGVPNP